MRCAAGKSFVGQSFIIESLMGKHLEALVNISAARTSSLLQELGTWLTATRPKQQNQYRLQHVLISNARGSDDASERGSAISG